MQFIQKNLLILICIFITFVAHSQVLEPENPKKATIQVENAVKISPTQINNYYQIDYRLPTGIDLDRRYSATLRAILPDTIVP